MKLDTDRAEFPKFRDSAFGIFYIILVFKLQVSYL